MVEKGRILIYPTNLDFLKFPDSDSSSQPDKLKNYFQHKSRDETYLEKTGV